MKNWMNLSPLQTDLNISIRSFKHSLNEMDGLNCPMKMKNFKWFNDKINFQSNIVMQQKYSLKNLEFYKLSFRYLK